MNRVRSSRRLILLIVALWPSAGALAVQAHGFWVRVTSTAGTNKAAIRVAVGFGEDFPHAEPFPETSEMTAQLIDPSGTKTPIADFVRDPTDGLYKTVVRPPTLPGTYAVEAVLRAKAITYAGRLFQDYLTREGMTDALSFRKSLHEESRDARESATLFAKTLFGVGTNAQPSTARAIGSKIELVPVGDSSTLRAGDILHVTVLFNGAPQNGVDVRAVCTGDVASSRRQGRTNAQGEADLVLTQPGIWLIRAVELLPGSAHVGEPSEWQSFWASLTVDVQPKR